MPTRTYTGLDLINYANGYISGPAGDIVPSVNHIGQANAEIAVFGSDSETLPPGGSGVASAGASFIYQLGGDLDFNAFPAIPDNALITKIEYKISASVTGDVDASASGTGGGTSYNATARFDLSVLFNSLDPSDPSKVETSANVNSGFGTSPQSADANGSDSDNYSRTTTIDLSSAPIDKATLISTYGNLLINLTSVAAAGINGFAGQSASLTYSLDANVDLSIILTNFQFIVTYESGPEITLDPAGGEVEQGESIRVSGDNVLGYTYAAVVGDQVIPIIPKKDGPDVILEVPAPAKDPCSDCYGECPECEDCVTACNEDLTGEACQECLAACLDCLVDCLEDLEAGEDCAEKFTEDPPTSIVIICGDPTGTQFTGTVPLGNFTVIVANASGIYKLVDGKSNDTLYRAERDGSTYDVKIPNPNGKSGFFRS